MSAEVHNRARARPWGQALGDTALVLVLVLATIVALHQFGSGSLASPPLGSLVDLRAWAEARDAVTVGIVLVRLVALGAAYHLAISTGLVLAGRALRLPRLVRLAALTTLPPFRGTVGRITGLTMSVSAALTVPITTAAAMPGSAAAVATTTTLPADAVGAGHLPRSGRALLERGSVEGEVGPGSARLNRVPPSAPGMDPGPGAGEATLARVGSGPGAGEATLAAVEPTAAAPEARGPDGTTTAARPSAHRVRPGDHLWSIAARSLEEYLGRPATEAEIRPYWRAVVTANPQLDDADLLFTGDLVQVPAPGNTPP